MLQNQTSPTGSSRPNEPHWFIGNKWRLSRHLVSISWNVQWKNFGSNPLVNLYQNFMHWTSNISLTLSNFSYLNKGSVCTLYLLKVIIRMDSFCNLIIPLVSKPQQVIPNCKWGSMSESYISLRAENGKYRFNLLITPNVRDILFAIVEQWLFPLRDSLIVNPRKFPYLFNYWIIYDQFRWREDRS